LIPFIQSIRENKEILSKKQTELLEKEEKILILKNWQKNSDKLKAKVEKINALWPNDKDVSKFIVDLENLANQENLTLRNVTVSESNSKSKSKNKRKEIQFSFDTKSDFGKDLATITQMERFSRFNTIKQINFNRDEEGLVTMKVTGTIYYGD
jgi:Tfp pilus assembly protein PilO